jgi:hypothetical protein
MPPIHRRSRWKPGLYSSRHRVAPGHSMQQAARPGTGTDDILLRDTSGSLADWTMNGAQIAAVQLLTFGGSSVSLASS